MKSLLLVLALLCGQEIPPTPDGLKFPPLTFDNDPQESSSDDHVMSNREGAAGGKGAGGGGCGCN